jgi:hypothetical protein
MALDKNDAKIIAEAISTSTAQAVKEAIKNTREDTKGLSPEQIERLEALPAPKRWRRVACRSDETGATFSAHVVESRTHPAGRIVELHNYTLPPGVATYQKDGGLVPDLLQILRVGAAPPPEGVPIPKHDLTPHYLQWRTAEIWQRDLLRFVGKELRRSLAVDDAAFTTPWQEGRVRADLGVT